MDTMPFGKHKGKLLADLDIDYICWLLDQDFISGPLRIALDREREERQPRPQLVQKGTPAPPPALEQYFRAIILKGFQACREIAKDQPEKLKNLQAAREKLEEFVGL